MNSSPKTTVDVDLSGRVAVIAGGASPGMGRATAVMLAEAGASVAVLDVNRETGEETLQRLRDVGSPAIFIETDMMDALSVESAADQCVRDLGGLDILFNNTGVPSAPNRAICDFEPDEWDRNVQLNLKSAFLGMKYAIPHMISAGGGSIVNNASVSGLRANIGSGPYGVAKAGVIQLTKIAALEYAGHGIRVNAVCPYSISRRESDPSSALSRSSSSGQAHAAEKLTEAEMQKWQRAQLPMHRSGRGYEVANVVKFLVSDAASWVNGAAVPVDGASSAGYYGSFR